MNNSISLNNVHSAHKHSSNHYNEIYQSKLCGCFYCLEIYSPNKIKQWIKENKENKTALCPNCGIDSVIGSQSLYPITKEFLQAMKDRWFSEIAE